MFGSNLKKIMNEKGFTLTMLSQKSGIGKSSLSQYISGKHIPPADRVKALADALEVPVAEISSFPTEKPIVKQVGLDTVEVFNVPVKLAAQLMHKKDNFLYEGLQQGVFPFGYAVKISSKWSYFISSVKFTECTGIQVKVPLQEGGEMNG